MASFTVLFVLIFYILSYIYIYISSYILTTKAPSENLIIFKFYRTLTCSYDYQRTKPALLSTESTLRVTLKTNCVIKTYLCILLVALSLCQATSYSDDISCFRISLTRPVSVSPGQITILRTPVRLTWYWS